MASAPGEPAVGEGAPPRGRLLGWTVGSAAAVLAASVWLSASRVEYLVVAALATATAAWGAYGLPGRRRVWGGGIVVVLAALVGVAFAAQRSIDRVERAWALERDALARESLVRLAQALDATALALDEAAREALGVAETHPGVGDRFARLRELAAGPEERAVVLFEHGRPVAWGGRARLLPDSSALRADSTGRLELVASPPFYLSLYAVRSRGARQAVATALISAAPPADRLARSLTAHVAEEVNVAGFTIAAADVPPPPGSYRFAPGGRPLFDARPLLPQADEARLQRLERARLRVAMLLALALTAFIVAAWRVSRALGWRLLILVVALVSVAVAPLNAFSNRTRLFDSSLYFTPLGGPLTANAGALGLTSGLVLLALLTLVRRHATRLATRWAAVGVLLVAGLGPFLLRNLARGIRIPPYGVSSSLWLIWEIPLFLAAVSVLLAGALAGSTALGRTRGLPPLLAPTLAALAAFLGPVVWEAPHQWPWWYTLVWTAAIGALTLSRQSRQIVVHASVVAALGASTLVWSNTARGRVELARRDLAALSVPDQDVRVLLERLAPVLSASAPTSRAELLQQYVTSDLAAAALPVELTLWRGDSLGETLRTGRLAVPAAAIRALVLEARTTGRAVVRSVPSFPAAPLVLAVPGAGGSAVSVAVAPRTRLVAHDPFARLFGLELPDQGEEPPYGVQLTELAPGPAPAREPVWRRVRNELHGDLLVRAGLGMALAHVEVELRPLDALVERGVLIALLNLALVGVLWLMAVLADGAVGRWVRVRQRSWWRSYRARLSVALFAFFVIPAAAFAVWSYRQLLDDAARSRELLVRETLRAVTRREGAETRRADDAPAAASVRGDTAARARQAPDSWLDVESRRLDTPLLLYRAGALRSASDSLLAELAPVGRLLPAPVALELALGEEETASWVERVADVTTLFGFRAVDRSTGGELVLAAPARTTELALDRRRRDLAILVLFATAAGALAALWLSGLAARELARPIGSLRTAALAIARGEREPPLAGEPTAEFLPVFAAFRRMAADLSASRFALEAAQRRTAAVLRNVASAVIAVDEDARVTLANPRADALVGEPLESGRPVATLPLGDLAARVDAFLAGVAEEEALELALGEMQLRVRITRLGRGGAVITMDDVTALARAQRVLAWGEMARQVAHEIKNPLTPIRLGVQHLRRAYTTRRGDYEQVLEQNVERILAEIDRLDEIARAFSRYGTPPAERAPAEPVDVAAVVRDVVALESMGESDVEWRLRGAEGALHALARRDELHEVLLNVLENARLARARRVEVALGGPSEPVLADASADGVVALTIRDDGHGIPAEVLPRIFEPHFSTRTSGSGLGLAISRRLLEGWGGGIAVTSEAGEGTTVRITLRRA